MHEFKNQLNKLKNKIIKRDVLLAITIAFGLIVLGSFMGWYNNKIIPANQLPIAHYSLEKNNPLSFMANWDSPDYINIAKHGYTEVSISNYFPLYPITIRLVKLIINSWLDSALLIAYLSLIGAVYFFLKILKLLFNIKNNTEAIRGLVFFGLFPTAVFLIAAYTESLFAFLALGAIYFALKNKYLPAAFFALLCTATHITGIFVLILMIMILLEQKLKISKIIISFIVGSVGLLSYMFYLWDKFKKPLAFITSQESHGWLKYGESRLITTVDLYNVVFIILLIISTIYWWRKRKSFSIYSFLFLLIPIVGKQFGGFNRYVLMAFPIQLMLYGYLKDKRIGYLLTVVLFAISWSYFLFQYAGGYIGG